MDNMNKMGFLILFTILSFINCSDKENDAGNSNGNGSGEVENVDLWVENSLIDIFHDLKPSEQSAKQLQIEMVRNESESMQIALRSPEKLSDVKIEIEPFAESDAPKIKAMPISLVLNSKSSYGFTGEHAGIKSTYKRRDSPAYFPEYYTINAIGNVDQNRSYGIAIEATSTSSTPAGTYNTTAVLSSGENELGKIPITITVHDVVLPDPKDSQFSYTNWITPFHWWSGEVNETYNVCWSVNQLDNNFFTLMSNFAKVMKKERQNTIMVPLGLLLSDATFNSDGKMNFTFKSFDRYIQAFIDNGSIKNLEGEHWYEMNWNGSEDPYNTSLVAKIIHKGENGKAKFARVAVDSPEAQSYFDQFIPLLYNHLKAKGWEKMWIQHVQDEPMVTVQHVAINEMYNRILREMPMVRTVDAGSRQKDWFADDLSIFCPQINYYEEDRSGYDAIGERPNQELWTYTCVNPQMDDFMTRIADYPLLSSRVIGWYLWQRKITGYLHWAWNLYGQAKNPNQPFADMYCEGAAGDGWLVYPDKENHSVYEGPRSTSVRDSFEDYEILALAAKKNLAQTQTICAEIVSSGTQFVREPEKLLEARLKLIQLAAK
ncbi:MAG: DUF4091 domain-containing protein [Prevotella sp.]|jgi:hypothetical protein|nr:DUF4091 domain-containing protein [Prevotella sp.]